MATQILNIQPKPSKWNSAPKNEQGVYNAEINKTSIRIFGVMTNHIHGPQRFDLTFNIGSRAEYHSYNLKYVGNIVAIGPKTVTIKHYSHSDRVTRLDLYSFIDRNWDFDAEKIDRYNAEEMMCL